MYIGGEFVMYGIHGACKVIGTEKQLVNRKRTEFLVLEPVGKAESRFYVPTANETAMAKLCPVLSKPELDALLHSDEIREGEWISNEGVRKQYYRELMGSCNRLQLLKMVSTLYRYRNEQLNAGKKFHLCDDNFLRDAERLLCSEISLVQEKSAEEAREYLRTLLK